MLALMTSKSDAFADDRRFALRVREHVVRMAGRGGCFLGASLSCVDLVTYLYRHVLRVDRHHLTDPERDYFLLSKGHDVPALYGTLAELGFIDVARLERHLSPDDALYFHPSRALPGVEFHSGSLGHLLSVGIGIALDLKLVGTENRVYVLVGDGELDEGSMWEALLVASAHRLDNLVVIVDRNGFQANGPTETILPLEPLADKLRAFGARTVEIDGHDFAEIDGAFRMLGRPAFGPTAIIARTKRNRGLPSIEGRADRWFVSLTPGEADTLVHELHGGAPAELTSPTLTVR